MIRDSMYFSYAGKKSSDFGIINVTIGDNMMLEEPLASSREILEESIKGSTRPYFQGMKKSPLRFSVSFAFEDRFNTAKIREVARWLTEHDYYQPLYFTNDLGKEPEKIYYALVIDEPTLIHNGLQHGYITISFRCDSPYAYSPPISSRVYEWKDAPYSLKIDDFSTHTLERTTIDNSGDLILQAYAPRWSDIPAGTRWKDL